MKYDNNVIRDRIRGCLVGGSAGDALGYAVEFIRLNKIKAMYGAEGITKYDPDPVVGAAIVSDDTQMALFTATGLLTAETARRSGQMKKNLYDYVLNAYLDWYRTQGGAYVTKPVKDCPDSWLLKKSALHVRRAPGNTCLSALSTSKTRSLYKPINNSKGCGTIMRIAPVGILYPEESLESIVEMGAEISALTHGHPLGCFPSGILAAIIQQAIYREEDIPLTTMTERAVAAAKSLYGKSDYWDELEELIDRTVDCAGNGLTDEENIKSLGEGWVADESLAVALYCALRHEDDFSAGLIASVNHDGDSDSTGISAGNILGALHGFDAMDEKWKTQLELIGTIQTIADDLWKGTDITGRDLLTDENWMYKYGTNRQRPI